MIPWGLPDFVPLRRHSDSGADFVANVAAAGWWDWEDPLPVVFAGLQEQFPGAFYDVGANTGFYSVLMARLDSARAVRAFEPLEPIADVCRDNLRLAGLPDLVEPIALSDQDGPAEIYLPHAQGSLIETKASLDRDFNPAVQHCVTIACERLDTANSRLGGERLGMVKVDVEGAEHRVLAGGLTTIARDRPLITLELLEGAHFDAVTAFLATYSYTSATLEPGLHVTVSEQPRYVASSWNHLLVPTEQLTPTLARLAVVAEHYRELRRQLGTPTAEEYLDSLAADLPVAVLLAQLAIRRRMILAVEAHAKQARMALAGDRTTSDARQLAAAEGTPPETGQRKKWWSRGSR